MIGRPFPKDGAIGPAGATGATGADGAPGPNLVTSTTVTTLTGLLMGDGAHVAVATAGTDYATPAGVAENYVPFSGANQDVDLGSYAVKCKLADSTGAYHAQIVASDSALQRPALQLDAGVGISQKGPFFTFVYTEAGSAQLAYGDLGAFAIAATIETAIAGAPNTVFLVTSCDAAWDVLIANNGVLTDGAGFPAMRYTAAGNGQVATDIEQWVSQDQSSTNGIDANANLYLTSMPTSDPANGRGTLWYDPITNIVYRGT
jgi:hypothetical protein